MPLEDNSFHSTEGLQTKKPVRLAERDELVDSSSTYHCLSMHSDCGRQQGKKKPQPNGRTSLLIGAGL
jgi:hypothetical protein